MLILSICFLICSIILCLFAIKRLKLNEDIRLKNQELERINKELNDTFISARNKLNDLQLEISIAKTEKENLEYSLEQLKAILNDQDNYVKNYIETQEQLKEEKIRNIESQLQNSKKESQSAFEHYWNNLEKHYNQVEIEYDDNILALKQDLLQEQEKVNEVKKMRAAVLEAKRREEEIESQKDFYRLHLSSVEETTISLIEEIKSRIPDPRVLCMLIWSTYFQKQTTALCNNILGTAVVSGIYKITNIKSGLCYIGQAVDIAARWKQHVKCGLGIDTPAQNKLYQAMRKEGIVNFTFELLEKCEQSQLNEKERKYIDLYQSYDFGYNSTKGNK